MLQIEMSGKSSTLLIVTLLSVMAAGIVTILLSFTPLVPSWADAAVIRTVGFVLAFAGLGEFLNHPRQERLHFPEPQAREPITISSRRRNPCALGNLLDIFALILVFVALARLDFF